MRNGSLSYKIVIRIVSIGLIAFGLYLAWRIAFVSLDAYGPNGLEYSGPIIFGDPGVALTSLFYSGWNWMIPGPFCFVSMGLFGLALSTRRAHLVYWSLQVLLWFGSMSFWFSAALFLTHFSQQNGINVPGSFAPFFAVTLVISVLLFILYIPVVRLLRKWLGGAVLVSLHRLRNSSTSD